MMEMLSKPLLLSERENILGLAASEKLAKEREQHGDAEGNRHQRRLAARRERLERRREKVL